MCEENFLLFTCCCSLRHLGCNCQVCLQAAVALRSSAGLATAACRLACAMHSRVRKQQSVCFAQAGLTNAAGC